MFVRLNEAGYTVGFYTCSEGNYKEEWETEYNAMVISRISSKVFFITVTKDGAEVDLDVEAGQVAGLLTDSRESALCRNGTGYY